MVTNICKPGSLAKPMYLWLALSQGDCLYPAQTRKISIDSASDSDLAVEERLYSKPLRSVIQKAPAPRRR